MTRIERYANLTAVVLPFVAFVAAVVLLWNSYVGVSDLVAFAVMYLIAGFGVTVGFHRLLTHRAFQTHKPIEYGFAIAGMMSVQGPVVDWVADHRKHHAHADEEGDPHSPHVQFGEGWMGALKGLFHAHMGWLFSEHGQAERRKYAKDLVEDRGMRRINRRFHWWVLLGLAMGSLIGFVLGGFTLKAALTGLLWGGFVRIFLQHHVTWSINSVCHFFGRRRFDVEDESTNVFWLAVPSLGEAWHHNHHAFPRSARHGLRWWEIDLSAALIGGLEKLGLAWNVTKIAPERQAQKLAGAAREPAGSGEGGLPPPSSRLAPRLRLGDVHLRQRLLRDRERRVRGREPGVDGGVEQHLGDLRRRQAVRDRRADVHRDLVLGAQRGQSGQRDDAARAAVEAV